jgi:methyl-accepting chemotaxis protein
MSDTSLQITLERSATWSATRSKGVSKYSRLIFAACDVQTKSTEDITSKVTEISSSTSAVADNIAQAEQTARATEAMAADVVNTANLLQNQADSLQDQVANFVLQLRSVGSRGKLPAEPIEVVTAQPLRGQR